MELTVRVHEEDGGYWAEVVELPGCFASGDSLDELKIALGEAASLYLHDRPDAGELAEFRPARVDELKIAVPA